MFKSVSETEGKVTLGVKEIIFLDAILEVRNVFPALVPAFRVLLSLCRFGGVDADLHAIVEQTVCF